MTCFFSPGSNGFGAGRAYLVGFAFGAMLLTLVFLPEEPLELACSSGFLGNVNSLTICYIAISEDLRRCPDCPELSRIGRVSINTFWPTEGRDPNTLL